MNRRPHRHVLRLLVACALVACHGDDSTTPITPVGTVALSQGAITIGRAGTAQVVATARDANGAELTDRIASWSSSNPSVATVGETGIVTALAKGSATITATIDGRAASVPVTVLDVVSVPAFQRPFAGEFLMSNFMDHDVPYEFVDDNGRFTTFWGEQHANTGHMIDGHSGYDFTMPVGTPLLAVADGVVLKASTTNTPFYCPLLKKDVSDMVSVQVLHTLPNGMKAVSFYMHLSQLSVTTGQAVTAGMQLGLSGNSGCTTGPHLHFEVYLPGSETKDGQPTPIDPFGWAAPSPDPWEVDPHGAQSMYLWKPGEAPILRRGASFAPNPPVQLQAVVTQLALEGVRDDVNPNNEYVQISLNPQLTSASLDGYRIVGDKSGVTYALPKGIVLTTAEPKIRVYTGAGANSPTAFYMGRPSGIWTNLLSDDCLRLMYPDGGQVQINLGNGCPSALASLVSSTVMLEVPKTQDYMPRPR